MDSRSVLLGGFCFVTVVVAAALYAQNSRLQQEQVALRSQLEAVTQTAAAAQAHASEDKPHQPLTQNDQLELMRLRNEVTQLRASATAARDALKAALQNRSVNEAQLAENGVQPLGIPGEVQNAPQEGENYDPLAFHRRNPELMKRYFPHLYREGAENQAVQPANAPETAPDAAPDPLAFYRKNPELMKRYFPHLANAAEEQTPDVSTTEQAPLPPDAPNQN